MHVFAALIILSTSCFYIISPVCTGFLPCLGWIKTRFQSCAHSVPQKKNFFVAWSINSHLHVFATFLTVCTNMLKCNAVLCKSCCTNRTMHIRPKNYFCVKTRRVLCTFCRTFHAISNINMFSAHHLDVPHKITANQDVHALTHKSSNYSFF